MAHKGLHCLPGWVIFGSMLSVISPAKTLDFESEPLTSIHSCPAYLKQSKLLIGQLKACSEEDLCKLMSISSKLAALNQQRYQSWSPPFTPKNAKQALLAFKGDVYTGFQLADYQNADYAFAQKHLRILSGLYGLLRPMDLIQPYRLEMGTSLNNPKGNNLYAFWGDLITKELNGAIAESGEAVLINLASNEYFQAVVKDQLEAAVITPIFKDLKKGQYKIISFFAKKARGTMSDFIIRNRLKNPEDLKDFTGMGYRFDEASSTLDQWVFLRDQAA